MDFARYLGCSLNLYVVVNFPAEDADIAAWLFTRVRDKYRDWYNWRTKKVYGSPKPALYVYTLENPNGQAHANWVVYVPPALRAEFLRKLPGWVRKAKGRTPGEFDVKSKDVEQSRYKSLGKYINKGLRERYGSYLHITTTAQGPIYGRRACSSAAINKAARAAAGFVPKRDRIQWHDPANRNSTDEVA
ncbi:hypothetical protein [Mesorhizobium sp.]|uniref:hypothetical protein n=1 Tax=Mesorhizobium sp. TaxID=1871066 RepID=UPI000FE6B61E|nr:hypothetical protein [Mesorhizobium sp.]RWM72883.1 MAG: hypothetical protein EOR82_12105 [Mesorhizobium sp.]TIO22935.1 MAG: hypothetical protein E5X83_22855 [Mesorhizobium sp.]TJV57376.1 MAG: hypothetical protein E5X82_21950 [Mesorhizobium sp.]